MEYLLNGHILRNMERSSAVNKKENRSEYLPETGVLKVFHGISTIRSENIQRVVHRKRSITDPDCLDLEENPRCQ